MCGAPRSRARCTPEWLQLAGRLEDALTVADASTDGLAGLTSTTDLVQQRSASIGLLCGSAVGEARERLAGSRELARWVESPRALAQTDMDAAMVEIAVGDGAEALRHLDAIDTEMLPAFPAQLDRLVAVPPGTGAAAGGAC